MILSSSYLQPIAKYTYTASNGIVIATEKKTSSILIDDSMIEKVAIICPHIGAIPESHNP